jgi:heme/copper-type cytochrome/quinol oxidase subunit 1
MALGFGVWLHHMFATGIPFLALAFFSGASFAIAITSAVAFAWIATIWTGRPVVTSAFLYYAGFLGCDIFERRARIFDEAPGEPVRPDDSRTGRALLPK